MSEVEFESWLVLLGWQCVQYPSARPLISQEPPQVDGFVVAKWKRGEYSITKSSRNIYRLRDNSRTLFCNASKYSRATIDIMFDVVREL